jgi:hypothetical protein
MWKSDLIVGNKGHIMHSPCGNCCGNLLKTVENPNTGGVFHISTGQYFTILWKCGKLEPNFTHIKRLI